MKRISLFLLSLMAMGSVISAQDIPGSGQIIDDREDTLRVTTINDIITVQEFVSVHSMSESHFKKVWGRTTYFNIGYNKKTDLEPKVNVPAGLIDPADATNGENPYVEPFTNDWGASITLGHNYKLHRKPIFNVAQFNIDYTYINLFVNHFKKNETKENEPLYNSSLTWEETNGDNANTETRYYIPWNCEKYEFDYSMELGPSLTIAPFTYINYRPLHFFKFNIYYHWGYNVSMILINSDKKFDANPNKDDYQYRYMNESKQVWGHGMTKNFGMSFSWKGIGVGFETRKAQVEYQSMQTGQYGHKKYKFDNITNRVYLQIRY